MGCFLSCFRGGSDSSSDLRDPLVRESRLGDAFVNDEKKIEAGEKLDVEVANGGGIDEELLRETPPEILKVSIPACSEDANEDPLIQGSHLGDAFLTDETSEKLDAKVANGGVDEELLREANYLKSYGTISLTPPEILEVSSPTSSEDTNKHIDTSTNVQAMKEAKLLEGDLSEVYPLGVRI